MPRCDDNHIEVRIEATGAAATIDDVSPDSTTDVIQTCFVGAQLAVLAVAAVFGWRQLSEARKLREDQTRPFVIVELGSSAQTLFDLVVSNIGPTLARDVRFDFNPPIKSSDNGLDPYKIKMFREGISSLAPGREIRTLFDQGPKRRASELPDFYEVTVSYTDQSRKRHYSETIDLDFGVFWDRLNVNRKGIHDVFGELEKIRKELSTWSASIGSGLLIVSPNDVNERNRDALEQLAKARQKDAQVETQKPSTEGPPGG